MKNLYFIRHGLSQANLDDVWGGQNETPLTETGREQARLAAAQINEEKIVIDLIFSSPLSRALNTAKIIAEENGYPVDKIRTDRIFLERSFGVMDGMQKATGFFKDHTYQDLDLVEKAETIDNLQKRASAAFDILKACPEETILLVGHGAFGRALRRVVDGQPSTDEYVGQLASIPNSELVKLV